MIIVTVFKQNGIITGFETNGHAGYAKAGKDIICSAVSALTINAINSVESLTKQRFECELTESDGYIHYSLYEPYDDNAQLLLKSLILGLEGIIKDYGKKYVDLRIKEV